MILQNKIEKLIEIAVQEDLGSHGDISSLACIPEEVQLEGTFSLKQSAVVSGLPFLEKIFQSFDPTIRVHIKIEEGSSQKAGTILAEVAGPARGLLAAERSALNFLQYCSGISTTTAEYVRKVEGYGCAILATRATLPGLRPLAQYAVGVGGGAMHRYCLAERIIIKRNHLAVLANRVEQPMVVAVERAREKHPTVHIELEIRHLRELAGALKLDVQSIVLDNMSPDEVCKSVKLVHAAHKKAWVQSSAEISLETIREFARSRADGICIGALTHSVPNIQIRLKFKEI